jgi:carboxylesterase type B
MYSLRLLRTLAVASFAWNVLAEPQVVSKKSQVTYQGTTSESVEHFQNIKYAHDTSGERRFSPPVPFNPPPGTIIDATSPGPSCPQTKDAMLPFFSETDEMSEDCLHLRISRPAGLKSDHEKKLPVVVWIHGGGVVKSSGYDPHFDPTNLITLSVSDGKPVIYVAINFRLSIFGFARLPSLESARSLNVGMRDQRMALEWVRDNIEDFGGDPERITTFGLSAGGTSIGLQLMAYGGEQGVSFQQAWMMSGPPGTALNMTSDTTETHTRAVAAIAGCGSEESEMLECLRKVPMEQLIDTAMDYSRANHPPASLFTIIPSVDDDFFPEQQSKLVEKGKFLKGKLPNPKRSRLNHYSHDGRNSNCLWLDSRRRCNKCRTRSSHPK